MMPDDIELCNRSIDQTDDHLTTIEDEAGDKCQTELHKIALKLHEARNVDEQLHYVQRLGTLSNPGGSPSINVNAQDAFGNTALHYAALSGVEEAVMQLLSNGANLGIKNQLGETAVRRIMPSTLESFLDSCIQAKDGEDVSSQNYSITFNYSLLVPPRHSSQTSQQRQPPAIDEECEALWCLSTSTKHQHLLKHPLITSFLTLKWHSISTFYYVNLLVYAFGMCLLTAYILLLHSQWKSKATQDWLTYLWVVSVVFGTIILSYLLTIRMVRFWFSWQLQAPLRYFLLLESIMIGFLLILTLAVLTGIQDPTRRRKVSAVVVLLGWTEGLLVLGRHPRLSIYVTLFTTVSATFFRLLLGYSVLMIGFAFSFFLIFDTTAERNVVENSSRNILPDSTYNKTSAFTSILSTFLKVAAMITGELEYSELPFQVNPFTSRIIFVIFLFLITIVLMNLLNGMAVSDTQAIQSKAETIGYVTLVEQISFFEKMFISFWMICFRPRFQLTQFLVRHIFLFHQQPLSKTLTVNARGRISNESCIKPLQMRMYKCKCQFKYRLKKSILRNTFQILQERLRNSRTRQSPNQRLEQTSYSQILADVERLRTKLLQLENQYPQP